MDERYFKKLLAEDGESFECVVELLLKNLYPDYKFVHTDYSHDGGKDFYTIVGDKKIWVEAKCYSRHLELSRIAGTFIMADICQINKIIVFSKSKLTSGAFINLARYSSMHGKTLIVYNDADILKLIGKFKKIAENEEINASPDEIKARINTLRAYKDNQKDKNEYSRLLCIFAKKLFNAFAENELTEETVGIEVMDCAYYAQSNSANPVKLTKSIRAFDVFSAEIILRNSSLSQSKKVEISFENNLNNYRLMTNSNAKRYYLEPAQCLSAKFFFRVFNKAQNLTLPEPLITVDNKSSALSINTAADISIGCRLIGETSYLGIDSQNVSQLNINLNSPDRNFTPVLLYGKSGVGKSRFLQELKNARMESGNLCFLFGGDIPCNSVRFFLRQLLFGYYNFCCDDATGEIILPKNLDGIASSGTEKSLKFICNILNNVKEEFDEELAKKWFATFLKNNAATILIDNAQNLNKETFVFINNIISDLQVCVCNSEIVLAYNTELFHTSTAENYFKYYLNTVPKEYTYKIIGFDKKTAVEYLKQSLDPNAIREDITDLCEETVSRFEPNPLFLKQIIYYLYQQNIIVFQGQNVCFNSLERLKDALDNLPENIFNTIKYRLKLLIDSAFEQRQQIYDLFWAILVFGELPLTSTNCIDGIDKGTVKKCIELGFLKYDGNNALIFEHQLIAKSVLIIIQNEAYCDNPSITKIELSEATAVNLSKNLVGRRYVAAKFAVEACIHNVTCKRYSEFLSNLSVNEISFPLIPYIVYLIEKYNRKFHGLLQYDKEIKALNKTIKTCQERLGVNRTCALFSSLIDYHIGKYTDYSGQAVLFVEFLKFYLYELSPEQKSSFIPKLNKVGKELLSSFDKTDFEIWIDWAQGKNQMQLHDFESADKTLKLARKKAESNKNFHRIAEIEVQLAYLCGYFEDKSGAAIHWENASAYFTATDIYDTVSRLVAEGNAKLIKGDLSAAERICKKLLDLYYDKHCYAYLKSIIDDFACNYLIRKTVSENYYDERLNTEIKTALARFRSTALTYKTDVYLHAAHKTLVYCKFAFENYYVFRTPRENSACLQLISVLSEELLSNYEWDKSDFRFFYPVFKDIAETSEATERMLQYSLQVPQDKKSLFDELRKKPNTPPIFAPVLKYGVLSDNDGKVNLFHYSYKW